MQRTAEGASPAGQSRIYFLDLNRARAPTDNPIAVRSWMGAGRAFIMRSSARVGAICPSLLAGTCARANRNRRNVEAKQEGETYIARSGKGEVRDCATVRRHRGLDKNRPRGEAPRTTQGTTRLAQPWPSFTSTSSKNTAPSAGSLRSSRENFSSTGGTQEMEWPSIEEDR